MLRAHRRHGMRVALIIIEAGARRSIAAAARRMLARGIGLVWPRSVAQLAAHRAQRRYLLSMAVDENNCQGMLMSRHNGMPCVARRRPALFAPAV